MPGDAANLTFGANALSALETLLVAGSWTVLVYFALINGSYLVTSLVAWASLRRHRREMRAFDLADPVISAAAPPVAVIAPAYNEESTCEEAVRSLLSLDYPKLELIVVNDGSTDGTLATLTRLFDLEPAARVPTSEIPTAPVLGLFRSRAHPNLWVVDKSNGGKADALNAGINFCVAPLLCAMDADSLLDRDALLRIVRPFLMRASTVAAGGMILPINDCPIRHGQVTEARLPRRFLARIQVLEYLRAFLAGRVGWDRLGGTLLISGAFGLFRRQAVTEVGGFATERTTGKTLGEDMELILRMRGHGVSTGIRPEMAFVPDAVAWTEAPETLASLASQRKRWQQGLTDVLIRHLRTGFHPRQGVGGVAAYLHFFFLEMLGPVIEIAGYGAFLVALAWGLVSPAFAVAFVMVSILLGMVLSLIAVVLEESGFHRYRRPGDFFGLFALAVLENLGVRQLISVWRVQGLVRYLKGAEWEPMARRGFAGNPTPLAAERPDPDRSAVQNVTRTVTSANP